MDKLTLTVEANKSDLSFLTDVPDELFSKDRCNDVTAVLLHCLIKNNPSLALEQMDRNGIMHGCADNEVVRTIMEGFASSVSSNTLPSGQLLHFVVARDPCAAYSTMAKLLSKQYRNGCYDQMWAKLTRTWLNDSFAMMLLPCEYPYLNRRLVHDKNERLMWCDPFKLKKVTVYTGEYLEMLRQTDPQPPMEIVSEEIAHNNLITMIGHEFPFRLDQIMIAGGMPSLCLSSNFDTFRSEADIDVWVMADDADSYNTAMVALLEWAVGRGYDTINKITSYVMETNIIRYTKSDGSLPSVEVIRSNITNTIEIVQEFDHSGCQSWIYHGKFYCTPDYALYAPHSIAMVHTTNIDAYRAVKACIRGWKLCKGEGLVEIMVDDDTTVVPRVQTPDHGRVRQNVPLMFEHVQTPDGSSTINIPSLGVNFKYAKKMSVERSSDIDPIEIPNFQRYDDRTIIQIHEWLIGGTALSESVIIGEPRNTVAGYHIDFPASIGENKTIDIEYKYIDARGKWMPFDCIGSKTINVGTYPLMTNKDNAYAFECIDCPLHNNSIKKWL